MKVKALTIEKLLLLVILSSSLLVPFSRDLVATATPYIKSALQISPFMSSMLLAAYSLGRGLGQLTAGSPTDKFGPHLIFVAGSLLLVVASLLSFAFAYQIKLLIFLHFLQGAGVATQILTSRVIFLKLAANDATLLVRLFSLKKLAVFIFATVAPTVTVFMITSYGWASLYLLTAALAACFALLVLSVAKQLDLSSGLKSEEAPQSYRLLLANRDFLVCGLIGIVAYLWTHSYYVGVPYLLRHVFTVASYNYGLLLSLNMVGAALGAILNIVIVGRASSRTILFYSLLIFALLNLLVVAATFTGLLSLTNFAAFFFLLSIAVPCITANSMTLTLRAAAGNFRGRAAALFGCSQFIAGFIGSLVSGYALSLLISPEQGFLGWLGCIALLTVFLARQLGLKH